MSSKRCCAGMSIWASTSPWTRNRTTVSPKPLRRVRRRTGAGAANDAAPASNPDPSRETLPRGRAAPSFTGAPVLPGLSAAALSADAATRSAREAAAAAGTLDELRAALGRLRRLQPQGDGHPARLCRRQSRGACDGGRGSPGRRRGPAGQTLRGPLGPIVRPHAGRHRPRSKPRLHRQHRALASAGQSHPDPAGSGDLHAVHHPADRARQIPIFWSASAARPPRAFSARRRASCGRAAAGRISTPDSGASRPCRCFIRPICSASRPTRSWPGRISGLCARRSTRREAFRSRLDHDAFLRVSSCSNRWRSQPSLVFEQIFG